MLVEASSDKLRVTWPALRIWGRPSLTDVCAGALLLWLLACAFVGGTTGPLHDAGTGFHIRVGQWITESGSVPRVDVFSFTRPGQPWFAWEWLADLALYLVWWVSGLPGVLVLGCGIIALSVGVLIQRMAARGANALVIVGLLHLIVGASSLHYLVRPHIVTLLFFAVAIHRRAAWWMVPLTALWANLHGGFAAFIVSLFVLAAGLFLEGRAAQGRRTAIIAAACGLASLANPYGWHEHAHILEYMRAGWVTQLVDEFHRPDFGTTEGAYFAVLMALSLAAVARMVLRGQYAESMLITAWVAAGLSSVRHIPILAICAAPAIAELLTDIWWAIPKRPESWSGLLDQIALDHAPGFRRLTLAFPVFVCVLWLVPLPWPRDFPESRFPVELATRHGTALAGARLFTTDSWADYLVYRNYPRQQTFVDGRSDFFGPRMSLDYVRALLAGPGWQWVLDRVGVNAVLLPLHTRLGAVLERSAVWRLADRTAQGELFIRR